MNTDTRPLLMGSEASKSHSCEEAKACESFHNGLESIFDPSPVETRRLLDDIGDPRSFEIELSADVPASGRWWTLLSESDAFGAESSEMEIMLRRPDKDAECPITLGPIETSELDFLPGMQFFEDDSRIREVRLTENNAS